MELDHLLMFSRDDDDQIVMVASQDLFTMQADQKRKVLVDMIEMLKVEYYNNEERL